MVEIREKFIFFHSQTFPKFRGQDIYVATKLLNHINDPQLAGILRYECNAASEKSDSEEDAASEKSDSEEDDESEDQLVG